MSDKILWNELRQGKHSALEKIYRTHFNDLYSYGKKFSTNEATVEDGIQELFIELWNNRERLSETDAIKPYLYVSLKRKLFREVKKIRKSTDTELVETHFEAELAIDQLMIKNEMDEEKKQNLKEAFKTLSERQKEILYLKYYSNMDYKDISETMELNYQSARNLVARAIQKLSKYMLFWWFLAITYLSN